MARRAAQRVIASRKNRTLLEAYLSRSGSRKLQIGSGRVRLPGWLNTDVGLGADIFFLDATRTFPLPSDTFDYVFSEHMIEHIPYGAGRLMLRECARVLKPGGVVRIVTPDLAFLFALYSDPQRDLHRRYIRWACDDHIEDRSGYDVGFVVNAFVRHWGHQFIYDESTLGGSLRDAGFSSIKKAQLGDSEHAELRELENRSRMPEEFFELESLAMEARKPRAI